MTCLIIALYSVSGILLVVTATVVLLAALRFKGTYGDVVAMAKEKADHSSAWVAYSLAIGSILTGTAASILSAL